MRPRPSTGFPFGGRLGWRLGTILGIPLFRVRFSMTRRGAERLPDGPMVVAANHFSHLDPVVVGFTVWRHMRYLAVDELYGANRILGPLLTWLGTIPLSRTRIPLGALRAALAELAAGGSVGVFPEGVRVWRWGERPPKRGAAWLARRAGVPLVPVAVMGTDEAMGRGTGRIVGSPIAVEVCEPIFPADFDEHPDPLAAMTALWQERIDAVVRSWYGA